MSRILVPFDFSENAQRALLQAYLIAVENKSEVEVLLVVNDQVRKQYQRHPLPDTEQELKAMLASAVAAVREKLIVGYEVTMLTIKESVLVVAAIIQHVLDTKPTLVVMGTHGWSGISDKLLGSNTSSLINHALFPILAVPHSSTPAILRDGLAAVQWNELPKHLPAVEKWAEWMNAHIEVVSFSAVPEAENSVKLEEVNNHPKVTIAGLAKPIDSLSMAENIAEYAAANEQSFCLTFVHQRNWFEKLFDSSISEKVSGMISIPLLAVPIN